MSCRGDHERGGEEEGSFNLDTSLVRGLTLSWDDGKSESSSARDCQSRRPNKSVHGGRLWLTGKSGKCVRRHAALLLHINIAVLQWDCYCYLCLSRVVFASCLDEGGIRYTEEWIRVWSGRRGLRLALPKPPKPARLDGLEVAQLIVEDDLAIPYSTLIRVFQSCFKLSYVSTITPRAYSASIHGRTHGASTAMSD